MNSDLTIAACANKHGIKPLKKFGQNFIFDLNLCEKIVKASKIPNFSEILEIGPGPGGLTRALLATQPKKFTIIENDKRFINLLNEFGETNKNLNIIIDDALQIDLESIVQNKINIVSNLPYNIGTELLIRWLKKRELVESITIMLQKEVVERIRAKTGTNAYGRLSIICNILCEVEKCFDVKKTAFYPPPKVDSAIVRLVPNNKIFSIELINKLEEITKHAFGQRRKMLKTSLKYFNISELLNKLMIDENKRAENLTPEEYLNIAQNLL